jgi:uncharacterized protein (TIGR03437 family)
MKAPALVILCCCSIHAQINILTANGGNERTNANLQEIQLAPETVTPGSFGKIGTFAVDNQVYAQPLYVSGVSIPGRGLFNVLYVATTNNSVYAFNADSPESGGLLWQMNLGTPVPSSILFGQYGDVQSQVGILSTGAIDPERGVLYIVADTLQGGVPVFYLHALDLGTGAERLNGPVKISASVPGTGATAGSLAFDARQHLQRTGLLLANQAVYIGFGSHADQTPWHGWMISYDASDLSHQIGVYVSTPSGMGGAFWQSGRGFASDAQGGIYAVTGNGDYDGAQNFGQSFLTLTGAAPVLTGSWTSSDWQDLSDNDFDIAAGPALVPGTHTIIGADKGGTMYVLNGDAVARNAPASESGVTFAAAQSSIFNLAVWGRKDGAYVYVQGYGEAVTCYRVNGTTVDPVPVSVGSIILNYVRMGMTLSANGSQNGILWEISGNYNDPTTPGTLHAFDASNLANELWNSDMNGSRDRMGPMSKFASPTVANGRVYVPTFGNAVVVYGLLENDADTPPTITTIGNAASYAEDAISPGELVAIFGSGLGPATPVGLQLDDSGAVAKVLARTRVLFDGVPGPMIYTSAGQVNAIVPFGVANSVSQVQVEYGGQASAPVAVAVAASTPGIFSADGSGSGQALIINQDGTINSADQPAAPGSVVVFYATGAGGLSPAGQDGMVVSADALPRTTLPVVVQVGDQTAQVQYAGGAPGIVEGVIQVNVQLPDSMPAGSAVPVTLRVGDGTSQPGLTIAIKQ